MGEETQGCWVSTDFVKDRRIRLLLGSRGCLGDFGRELGDVEGCALFGIYCLLLEWAGDSGRFSVRKDTAELKGLLFGLRISEDVLRLALSRMKECALLEIDGDGNCLMSDLDGLIERPASEPGGKAE